MTLTPSRFFHLSKEECEQAQVNESLYGKPARCLPVQLPKERK